VLYHLHRCKTYLLSFHDILNRPLHPTSPIKHYAANYVKKTLVASRASINYNPMAEQTSEISALVLAHSYILRRIESDKVAEGLCTWTFARRQTCWQRDESQVIQHSCCGGLGESCVLGGVLASLRGPFSRQPTLVPKGPKREAGLERPLSHALTYERERSTTKSNATRDVENAFV